MAPDARSSVGMGPGDRAKAGRYSMWPVLPNLRAPFSKRDGAAIGEGAGFVPVESPGRDGGECRQSANAAVHGMPPFGEPIESSK